MTFIIILIVLGIALAASIMYNKHQSKVVKSQDKRITGYKKSIQGNTELYKEFNKIDEEVRVEKSKFKKLSKADKIANANNVFN